MARYFTLAQAEQVLPQVQRLLRDAVSHKAAMQEAEAELQRTTERIHMSGGVLVDVAAVLATRSRRDQCAGSLRDALQQIQETGALVKDLDIGLIDFMTRYRGREVCLCWKLGEDSIAFWHGADEGFRGRKPIDPDFLSQHRGESTH
jgi:hypothetical protein